MSEAGNTPTEGASNTPIIEYHEDGDGFYLNWHAMGRDTAYPCVLDGVRMWAILQEDESVWFYTETPQ